MALSAAFLMTSLSRGTVFAEVVPAELVKRTVSLARTFGPHAMAVDPIESRTSGSVERSVAMSDEALLVLKLASLRFTGRNVGMLLVAILSFSIATGIWIAMFIPGGFSRAQAAVLSATPGATAAPCHSVR
jgi:hypothetical protein